MPTVGQQIPDWLQQPLPDGFEMSNEWLRIVDFFVLHSPCLYQSNRRHSINDKWGHVPWASDRTLKWPLNQAVAGTKSDFLFKASSQEMDEALRKHHLLDNFPRAASGSQVAVFTKAPNRGNSGIYMSFFYHLRNALAHGRFGVLVAPHGEMEFAFEDGANSKGAFKVKARGIIRVDSLTAIIDLIENGPEAKPDIEKEILAAIESGLTTKKEIRTELELSDSDWRVYSKVLKAEGKITYDEHHHWSVKSHKTV